MRLFPRYLTGAIVLTHEGRISVTDRFAHLSGSAVLDVLNTVDWRLDSGRAIEQLVDVEAVLAWSHEAGLLDDSELARLSAEARRHPRRAEAAARRFREVREDAYAVLVDRDDDAIDRLTGWQQEAHAAARLGPGDGQRWVWRDQRLTLSTPMHRTVRSLVELMRSDRITQLHQCDDDVCGWVYINTSPRRNRRWCAAADCGDRNRARAYYQRHKAARR